MRDVLVVLNVPGHAAAFEGAARGILELVQERTGERPRSVKLFDHLRAISLQATPKFVAALRRMPGIVSVTNNPATQPTLIRPVTRRRIGLSG